MKHLRIAFSNPWFLLVFVLALALSLIPHFLIKKRYRRNRTRITSLVLHLIVLSLAILTLAGTTFDYELPNEQNEIILLVDSSDSMRSVEDERDQFVSDVLNYGKYDGFKIGIVKFGFDQIYAAPLSNRIDEVYTKYITSEDPDTSASDLASALLYTKNLFTYYETAKIVLVTDGIETDEKIENIIRSVSATGIKIDTFYLNSNYKGKDQQIMSLELPETHISVNDQINVSFSVKSNADDQIRVKLYDNETQVAEQILQVSSGINQLSIPHKFTVNGLHELILEIESNTDDIEENSSYHTFINIEEYKKVLILERESGESEILKSIIEEDSIGFEIDVVDISTNDVPKTLSDLREYDQVILNNISNADMPAGFIDILYEFVDTYGGGLFTVGGDKSDGTANTYNRKDMYGTKYQELIPVSCINYTPPLGVIIIVDTSGSMLATDSETGYSYVQVAALGALSVLQALSERDYIGVMTLESDYTLLLPLTPASQQAKIRDAIDQVTEQNNGGTVFETAIERATQQLAALTTVSKRHIILITDGMPSSSVNPETGNLFYEDFIDNAYKNSGITTSMVILGQGENSSAAQNMKKAVEIGHGYLFPLSNASTLTVKIREDIKAPEIQDVNYETFNPFCKDVFASVMEEVDHETDNDKNNALKFSLDGFYGVKIKPTAELVLVGDYDVPIYAQWKHGKGVVASLMVDLNGKWSASMTSDPSGRKFIQNICRTIMPTENIRPSDIHCNINGENYINQMSIYSGLMEDETLRGTITKITDGAEEPISMNEVKELTESEKRDASCYMINPISPETNYSRASFVIKASGTYEIKLEKLDSESNVISTLVRYETFSYSDEYDIYLDGIDLDNLEFVSGLSEKGNGICLNTVNSIDDIGDPTPIFDGFVTSIKKSFDPRFIFMIIAIVLFLTDIAVRKFKFKWIHEIIRDYKNKKKISK